MCDFVYLRNTEELLRARNSKSASPEGREGGGGKSLIFSIRGRAPGQGMVFDLSSLNSNFWGTCPRQILNLSKTVYFLNKKYRFKKSCLRWFDRVFLRAFPTCKTASG